MERDRGHVTGSNGKEVAGPEPAHPKTRLAGGVDPDGTQQTPANQALNDAVAAVPEREPGETLSLNERPKVQKRQLRSIASPKRKNAPGAGTNPGSAGGGPSPHLREDALQRENQTRRDILIDVLLLVLRRSGNKPGRDQAHEGARASRKIDGLILKMPGWVDQKLTEKRGQESLHRKTRPLGKRIGRLINDELLALNADAVPLLATGTASPTSPPQVLQTGAPN